jgi:hypothetical protein
MSCETHTTPAFGCSGCIDARKRGEWESAPVRTVRHVWQVPGVQLDEVAILTGLRVPEGATESDVRGWWRDALREAMLDVVEVCHWSDVNSDEWCEWWGEVVGRSRLLSLSIGAVVVDPPSDPAVDQPSLFGGVS